MAFIRSQVFCVFVSVFVVLFCVDLACRVGCDSDTIVKIANIGDDITLSCLRADGLYDNYKRWFRNGTLIATRNGVNINDSRFTQGVTDNDGADSNNLYISNLRINDSATFECFNLYTYIYQSYDIRVIGCSNCNIVAHTNPDKIKVSCTLDNYWTRLMLSGYIFLHGAYMPTAIERNNFAFSIKVTELNRLPLEFELVIYINNTEGRIKCTLPTQSTTSSFSTSTLSTTSLKQTTQSRPSSYTASKKMPVGRSTSISTTKHHTPTNKNASSGKNTRDGNITLIIVILGSVFILILIVIIIVLRCKKTKDRRENKHTDNASIKKEHPKANYESVEDGSRKGPEYATSIKELRETSLDQRNADHLENGGMIDNILYDSRDKIADSSISRVEGPLDDALYAMPDKRATINRESKSTSKVTDGSSNSDHLYGNSAFITQHEQIRGTLQQGDQYEDVKMPGSEGDVEEIALYDMPDKGPTRNTLKATPEAGQTSTLPKDEIFSVDALYAEVDKTKKK